jgi:WD40 repeat protein
VQSTANVNVRALAFSVNSRFLAASLHDTVQLWDLKKRQLKTVFQFNSNVHQANKSMEAVNSIVFLPNGDVVCGDQSGTVRIWDGNTGACTDMLLSDNRSNGYQTMAVNCMQLSPVNPTYLSAGFSDGSLSCWDLSKSDRTCRRADNIHSIKGSTPGIAALTYSPRNYKLVATAGHDGKIALVDTHNMSSNVGSKGNTSISTCIIVGEPLNAIAFSEDAVHTAVGTMSGKIITYDWRNIRSPVCSVDAHGPNPVHSLAFQVQTPL